MNEPQAVTNAKHGHMEKNGRLNGPHLESKWAQHLLGTYETPTQRKARLIKAREHEKIVQRENMNAKFGKFTSKPLRPPVEPRGLGKAMKGIKAP